MESSSDTAEPPKSNDNVQNSPDAKKPKAEKACQTLWSWKLTRTK